MIWFLFIVGSLFVESPSPSSSIPHRHRHLRIVIFVFRIVVVVVVVVISRIVVMSLTDLRPDAAPDDQNNVVVATPLHHLRHHVTNTFPPPTNPNITTTCSGCRRVDVILMKVFSAKCLFFHLSFSFVFFICLFHLSVCSLTSAHDFINLLTETHKIKSFLMKTKKPRDLRSANENEA